MPAWIIAVLCVVAALAIVRWVIVRYQRNVTRIVNASRNGNPIPAPTPIRRTKLYDR